VRAFFHAEGWASASLGISSAGAVGLSMNAWREKDQFETMSDLAANLDDAAMRQVLGALLKKFGGAAKETATAMPMSEEETI